MSDSPPAGSGGGHGVPVVLERGKAVKPYLSLPIFCGVPVQMGQRESHNTYQCGVETCPGTYCASAPSPATTHALGVGGEASRHREIAR